MYWSANTRGPLSSGYRFTIGRERLSARTSVQARFEGGLGSGVAAGSTALTALRAEAGSFAISPSTPASVASLTSARVSKVNGTTCNPAA